MARYVDLYVDLYQGPIVGIGDVTRRATHEWLALQESVVRDLLGRWVSEDPPEMFITESRPGLTDGVMRAVIGIGARGKCYFSVPITLEIKVR